MESVPVERSHPLVVVFFRAVHPSFSLIVGATGCQAAGDQLEVATWVVMSFVIGKMVMDSVVLAGCEREIYSYRLFLKSSGRWRHMLFPKKTLGNQTKP